jgi:hypothetical protein
MARLAHAHRHGAAEALTAMAGAHCPRSFALAAGALLLTYSCAVPMDSTDPLEPSASKPLPNLQMPTLGGKQFWSDRRWHGGWRIQENVLTGHYRLLDPGDRRQAWGAFDACVAELERLAPAPGTAANADTDRHHHLVVLLHGMGRSRRALGRMQEALEARGWPVASISYPSTRRSIAEHGSRLAELLEYLHDDYSEVSFVPHSLGGIVVRELLADEAATWREHLQPRRIVMLAPPNQGSSFAQQVESFAPFGWIFGDTGRSLTPTAMAGMAVPGIPVLVIAGARDLEGGWNPWLDGPNDGVVTVDETHLDGEAEHLVVDDLHTFLMNDEVAIQATLRFLASND